MGLKDFKIRFDNVHAIYQPGQIVSGHVIVNVDSVKKTRGIKIVILGSADTYWTADRQELNNEGHYENEQELVTAHEEYFKTEYYLLGSAAGNEIELTTGTHEYPFTCSLPTNLPSSFESDYGRIRYTIKATLDRPWKFDHETKMAFTVISTLDLNELPSVSEPIHMEKSKNFCCLCCGSPPLTINAKLPVRGYVPGQSIPVNLNIENQSGVTIKNVKVMLKKIVTYHATNPRTDKKICEDIVSEVSKGPVNGNEISSYEQKLDIPSIPPSNLDHCKIIDLEYKIEILACAQGWYHRNLSESTTIYIGTLPLSSYQMPQPHSPKSDQVDTGDSTKANEATGMYPTIPAPSAPEEPPSYTPAASNLYPNLAPPSYEESIFRSRGLRDRGESTHVIGIDQRFAPRYPVYNFSSFQ